MLENRWIRAAVLVGACALGLAQMAGAAEMKEYKDTKHGYKLKIPAQFQVQEEGQTTTWIYQPGSAPADTGKKKGGGLLKNLAKNALPGAGAADAAAGGGELQPALTIYVNWVWMPDVDSG
ncbi:MAG: hypothetical protein IT368_14805, partial [Candidatus Hydrogenedentes bacterium]|nr:hypothetical protein [Candidatus Hydrogenedentota bacterium]